MSDPNSTVFPTEGPTEPPLTYQNVLIGCLLCIGGNLLISVSLNVQKYTHMKNEERISQENESFHYTKDPLWWIGIILMVFGEIGNFSAYGYAPASLVAPLGTTTVIANMFIAVVFLKEKLRPQDLFGCALSIVGAFLLVNFSPKHEKVLTGPEINEALKQIAFLVYIIIEFLALIVLLVLLYKFQIDSVLVFLLICAMLASFTVISAKGVSGLIHITFMGYSQFDQPVLYVMVVILVVTAILQVKYLNSAMKLFEATVVVPTYFAFFTISAILSGIVFYREFWGMNGLDIFMFMFGCTLCFIGVFFITSGKGPPPSPSNEPKPKLAAILPDWLLSTYSRSTVQPRSQERNPILKDQSPSEESPAKEEMPTDGYGAVHP
ncbi:NIPA-like protein 2 isoform X1 [Lingula anatina]|uniref:NIPA-like protein 2 isoform X1 n=2 Tax=Lingula anatina TaxID=7574 RepID=A0A1S3H3K0_LINAN|nr:NIPA-like protein 2 isoform X1 [Lingula anatina]|eukprot:XP_013380532.1 NIPA-like protein 2 isoform X1 [Lingula anatina]